MNILLISPHFPPAIGGVETHLNDLCRYFNQQKHNVYVRTYKAWGTKSRGPTEETKGFIHIHRLWWPDFDLFFKLENYPLIKFLFVGSGILIDSFLFLLKNQKNIDVIQAHGFSAGLVGVILGKLFKKRIVINTHVSIKLQRNIMQKVIKLMLNNASKILVLTNGVKNSLASQGIPEKKIVVYHYWVSQKKFNMQRGAKRKLGWNGKFVALFVGRLIEVKGVKIIFKLAERLRSITFVIVGSGPLEKDVIKISRRIKNVTFLGKIDNNKLPLYYSASDVLLIPSLITSQEYEEGIPRVMIEALSCSLPVICTKSGGIPDVFDKSIGILVENEDSIQRAIQDFHSKKLNKYFYGNCRPYSLKLFSIKNAKIIEDSLYDKN